MDIFEALVPYVLWTRLIVALLLCGTTLVFYADAAYDNRWATSRPARPALYLVAKANCTDEQVRLLIHAIFAITTLATLLLPAAVGQRALVSVFAQPAQLLIQVLLGYKSWQVRRLRHALRDLDARDDEREEG